MNITDFRTIVNEIAIGVERDLPNEYLDYAGIIPTPNDARYTCTPINTKVFASTGGDGVHFSILEISERIQPVFMTVPMNFGNSVNDHNVVLGESLKEFIGLGFYKGWFYLEQIYYDSNSSIELYAEEFTNDAVTTGDE